MKNPKNHLGKSYLLNRTNCLELGVDVSMFMPIQYTNEAFDNFQIVSLLVNNKKLHYIQMTDEQWEEFEKNNPTKQFSMDVKIGIEAKEG
jgi:hypothetical protein